MARDSSRRRGDAAEAADYTAGAIGRRFGHFDDLGDGKEAGRNLVEGSPAMGTVFHPDLDPVEHSPAKGTLLHSGLALGHL